MRTRKNRAVCALIIICLISACLAALVSCNKTDYAWDCREISGFLKTKGEDIVAENGDKVRLYGVNAGGLFAMEEWMCPMTTDTLFELEDTLYDRFGKEDADALLKIYRENWWTDSDFDNIAALGMNLIRLPFTWRTLQNIDYTFKENAFDEMDAFIAKAAERGIYVILDLHGAHGSQNGQHHSGTTATGGDLYGNEENMRLTKELWVTVAEHYKYNTAVAGYDLLNEPEGKAGGEMNRKTPQWDYYDTLYKAIRAVDGNHIIFMESVWDHKNLPKLSKYGWENVVYEYHYYGWDNSNDLRTQKNFVRSKVRQSFFAFQRVPEFVGEYTFFENRDSWEFGLKKFADQGWSSAVWTYKVTGENSSWGIYNSLPDDFVVDPYSDSYEDIAVKWSSVATQSFAPNEMLIDVLSKYGFK